MDDGEKLRIYRELVLRWNRRLALVSRRTPEASLGRLIRHSLAAEAMLPEDIRTLIDVGSGAGLPGIPIAIRRPGMKVRLIERSTNKCILLREVVGTLALENTEVVEAEFAPGMVGGRRPLAVTAMAVSDYRALAKCVASQLNSGDGLMLFVAEAVAVEIAMEMKNSRVSWKKLEDSERTGIAWLVEGDST